MVLALLNLMDTPDRPSSVYLTATWTGFRLDSRMYLHPPTV